PCRPSAAGCPADRSSCRPGVSTRSRPGAEVTSRRPREPLPLHQPVSPADVLSVSEIRCALVTERGTDVKGNVALSVPSEGVQQIDVLHRGHLSRIRNPLENTRTHGGFDPIASRPVANGRPRQGIPFGTPQP